MIFVGDCSFESFDCCDRRFGVGCIGTVSFDDGEQTRRICNLIDVCSFGTSIERIAGDDEPFGVKILYEGV